MTLGDYVNVICTTVNRTDVDSKTACRLYVNRRYNQIYDAYLWRDAELVSAPLTMPVQPSVPIPPPPFPPPTPLPPGAFPFPIGMERVVKLGLYLAATTGNKILYDL